MLELFLLAQSQPQVPPSCPEFKEQLGLCKKPNQSNDNQQNSGQELIDKNRNSDYSKPSNSHCSPFDRKCFIEIIKK